MHLQGLVVSLGALVVFLGRHLLLVELFLPGQLGAGILQAGAGFEVVLLQGYKLGVADGGQHLALADAGSLQQFRVLHVATQRGGDGHGAFRRHVQRAVHGQARAHGAGGQRAGFHAAGLLLGGGEGHHVRRFFALVGSLPGYFPSMITGLGGSFGVVRVGGFVFLAAAGQSQGQQQR